MNKFKKELKLSCVKICKLFQSFGDRYLDTFLTLYFLFEVFEFKMY